MNSDSITITRPVIIKVRVTDSYKKTAAAELREAIVRLEGQLKQLEFHYKKIIEMEKNNSTGQSGNLHQIDVERQKIIESRRQLTERLKEIGALAPGQEVVHGRVESFVDVKVGDYWGSLLSVEIVLEDGRVAEIRQGGNRQGYSDE